MGIVDIQHPGVTTAIDTPQGFAVTPGKQEIDHGSEAPGVAAVGGAAFRQGHSVVAAASSEWIPDYVEDGFHMWDSIKDTKYERHWRAFVHIRNTQAADVMKRRIDRREEDQRILDAAPWYVSVPMQLLAGGSDPLNWMPGGVFVRGVKGGISIARSARSVGVAAGASTTAQELVLHGFQPTRELSETATNIGASVFLGSLIGATGAKLVKHAEWKRSVAALDRDVYGYPAVATGEARYTVTDSGRRFVTLDDGSDVFGNITPAIAREAGLESGPIRLPEGFHAPEHGKGELHIEGERGAQLRALGHKDAAEFVKSVTSSFEKIYRHDPDTVMLVRRDGRGIVAGVTLKKSDRADGHWEVITAGEFRQADLNDKELLWSRARPGGSGTHGRGEKDIELDEAAAGGNTSGAAGATAGAATRTANDIADNAAAREGTVGTRDSGLSSPHGSPIDETQAARTERLRQETDTVGGANNATGREGQAAGRAAGRAAREEVAGRDDRGGAEGGRRLVHEEPVPDSGTDVAGGGRGSERRSHLASKEEVAFARTGPPDGTNPKPASEEAAPRAASSHQKPGADSPGIGVGSVNRHGIAPELRVVVTEHIDNPDKRLFTQETTNSNAAQQIDNLDLVHAAHQDPERNTAAWSRMMAYAFGSNDVPIPPYGLLRDIHGGGAVDTLKKLTSNQRAAADHGVARGRAYREAYTKGDVSVEATGRLLMWSFLSRRRSPYVQESMSIDASKGIGPWIAKAAAGRFTKADLSAYEAWAKSVAPAGSGQPGARATGNLIKFGREFLIRMSAKDENGVTHLQRFHDMLSDPNMTGRQIRREFLKFGEDTGIDNKVVSFTLLVAGHNDVMVLDRVQVRALFDDGRFKRRGVDVYGGIGHNSRRYGGNGLARLTTGARGLLIYEAIERALERRVKDIYVAAGRPRDASVGRYQWETWQAHSGQEASHGTLAAAFDESAIIKVRAVEGEYGAFAHGARYGLDENGKPILIYRLPSGEVYGFTPQAFQALMTAVRNPSSGVVPRGFKVTESGNVPWFERREVSKPRLEELARHHSDLGRIAGTGEKGEVRGGEEAGATVLRRPSEWEVARADGSRPGGVVLRPERESPGAGGIRRGGVPGSGPTHAGGEGEAEEVVSARPPSRPPPDGATSIPNPTKAADQAALSHPDEAASSSEPPKAGGNDGKVRSSAAAGLVAAGLAAAGTDRADDAVNDPDPLMRIIQSPSAAARDVATRLFDDPRHLKRRFADVGFDASAETLMKEWNGGLKRAVAGTKTAYTEHWKAAGALDEREFNAAVGRALRNDGDVDDPQVKRAAKLWRSDVFGPITEAAVKAGLLPGDVDPAEAVSYFSRLWSRGKLFAMEAEFKATVAEFHAGRMAKEARREGERGSAADVRAAAREIADDLFDALTGRADGGSRPEFAGAHIPDALAAPFLEDDVERVGRSFVRTMGADLELAQNFGTPDLAEALQEVRAGYARRRAEVAGENERRALNDAEKRDIADLVALRDRVRGRRIEGTIERNYARIVRAASHLDAIRATGEVRLPSLPDAIRPAMVEGLSAYMQTAGRLATELEAVTLLPGEAALATKVTERVLAHRLSQLAGLDDPYAAKPPPDAFLAAMTDPASQGNGARIFADMVKSFTAVMVQDHILHGVRDFANLKPGQRALLRDLGIDQDVAQQIAAQFARHGEEVEGVNVANTAAWDKNDPTTRALRAFRAAVNKDTLFAATPAGEAMRAFKNFALASYQRLLLRVLDAKAERFMGGLIAMTTMGMFAAFMASRGVAQDAERWIGEGFDRSGIMAVPLELSDAFEKATGFDPLGPLKSPENGTRLLPFNAYPGIRQMLGYALHPHN
jgi:hypothetical protein